MQVVLALIPVDDAGVRSVVNGWADSVPFQQTVGRLCDLTQHPTQYIYNAVGLSAEDLKHVFDPPSGPKERDIYQDIDIRPSDRKGW